MDQNTFSAQALLNLSLLTAIVVGGVWWIQNPLTSSRPSHSESSGLSSSPFSSKKPSARLWQDPFEPYAQTSGEGNNAPSNIQAEKARFTKEFDKQVQKQFQSDGKKLLLMGIMVPGGHFKDLAEHRQRIRVALMSAMAAGGYAPEDTNHLDSFPMCLDGNLYKIPYEWFTEIEGPERRRLAFPSKYKRILVFWISDDAFAEKPLRSLTQLHKQVQCSLEGCPQTKCTCCCGDIGTTRKPAEPCCPIVHCITSHIFESPRTQIAHLCAFTNAEFAIFGPLGSSTLRSLLEEAKQEQKQKEKAHFIFYNTSATISPEIVLGENPSMANIKKQLSPVVDFHYTTCSDYDVAKAMSKELERRGIKFDSDQIALIAENDTLYGRALPKAFRQELEDATNNIKRFTYLRGLDGLAPQENQKNDHGTSSTSGFSGLDSRTSLDRRFVSTQAFNRPEGNNQFDYLMRLGDDMKRMERQNGRFKVIGILGSDVYDKLLLLQALRPLFPNALFFTTDLDAIYSHPQELKWTKNLLVASSHGLTLDEYYQCGAAPFRFSYQTALFQAILGATTNPRTSDKEVGEAEHANRHFFLLQSSPPRIFEIGRDKAYDISVEKFFPDSIHPKRPQTSIQLLLWRTGSMILLFVLFCVMLFVLKWHRKIFSVLKFVRRYSAYLLPVVLVVLCLVVWDIYSLDGEPWIWISGAGISTWPATMLQLLAFVVSAALILHVWKEAKKKIMEKLCNKHDGLEKFSSSFRELKDAAVNFNSWASARLSSDNKEDEQTETQKTFTGLWDELRGDIHTHILLFFTILIVVISVVLFLLSWEGNGRLPYRNGVSYWLGTLIWFCAWVATITLTLATFFITRSCCWFIKKMEQPITITTKVKNDSKNSKVHKSVPKRRKENTENEEKCNEPLRVVSFVKEWTEKIVKFVFYPVIPLVLLVVAESSYFDNFGYNPYRYVVLVLMGLLIFAPAYQLRDAARKLQKKKIEDAKKILNNNDFPENVRSKIRFTIEETENFTDGAFKPILEHPFTQAILILLGGITAFLIM